VKLTHDVVQSTTIRRTATKRTPPNSADMRHSRTSNKGEVVGERATSFWIFPIPGVSKGILLKLPNNEEDVQVAKEYLQVLFSLDDIAQIYPHIPADPSSIWKTLDTIIFPIKPGTEDLEKPEWGIKPSCVPKELYDAVIKFPLAWFNQQAPKPQWGIKTCGAIVVLFKNKASKMTEVSAEEYRDAEENLKNLIVELGIQHMISHGDKPGMGGSMPQYFFSTKPRDKTSLQHLMINGYPDRMYPMLKQNAELIKAAVKAETEYREAIAAVKRGFQETRKELDV